MVFVHIYGWMDGRKDSRQDGWMGGCMDGQIADRKDGWLMIGCFTYRFIYCTPVLCGPVHIYEWMVE